MEIHEKRPRIALACEICRKRKRKCDGIRPLCSWCLANNKECQYVEEKPRKRKWDDDYVASLEQQIILLREYVTSLESSDTISSRPSAIKAIFAENSHPTPSKIGVVERGAELDAPRDQIRTLSDLVSDDGGISSSDASALNDVSSMIWRMTIRDDGETSFTGPSGNFCFPTVRHDITSKSNTTERVPPVVDIYETTKPLVNQASREILFNIFSHSINPTHQFVGPFSIELLKIHTPSNMELLECAILAAGTVLSDDSETRTLGDGLASYARTIALHQCCRNPDVYTVQALGILSWRELALDEENMAWLYNSMAASLCLHLGLHVSSLDALREASRSVGSPSTKDSNDLRVRAFWSSFLLDRIATSLLGRNCMIPWRRVQAAPFLSATSSPPSMDELIFAAQCRLWFIHDQFMDSIYSFEFKGFNFTQRQRILLEAREQLLSFHRQLDPNLHLTGDAYSPNLIYLHMAYNTSQLLFHRPYLNEDRQTSPYQLALQSMSTAAGAVSRLIRDHQKVASFENAPPFIAHSILTAAIALLLGATSTDTAAKSQSIGRFRTCFKALESMQTRFSRARRAMILLQELAQRWKIIAALPIQYSFPLDIAAEAGQGKTLEESPESPGSDGLDASCTGLDSNFLLFDPTTVLDQGLFDFSTPGYELNMASKMFDDRGLE
ncbi:C6 transcription factor [Dactylonectria estremocensis]|uniref:C6 transcription factor n=1 Tax=Dactylonectria estremocensis TaxID=1079267 RepID=A0A9P9ET74_9HYPO|nr:C6 transcription factor [Dactylonectria estremocensis]